MVKSHGRHGLLSRELHMNVCRGYKQRGPQPIKRKRGIGAGEGENQFTGGEVKLDCTGLTSGLDRATVHT